MKRLTSMGITKKGNRYHTRGVKLANGFSQVLSDRKKRADDFPLEGRPSEKYATLLTLSVHGTTDKLKGLRWKTKTVIKHHPINPDYTKQVIVLNESGKRYYQRLKRLKETEKRTQYLNQLTRS